MTKKKGKVSPRQRRNRLFRRTTKNILHLILFTDDPFEWEDKNWEYIH